MFDDDERADLHARTIDQDVHECGTILGDTIKAQESQDAFDTVETLRTAAIEYRSGERDSREGLHRTLDRLSPDDQSVVARAFTSYFELTNLAEERERVRSLRRASEAGDLAGSLEAAAAELADADVEQVLGDVLIEPTFTAHPTEARRKTIKAKLRSIASFLETMDERRMTERELQQVDRHLAAEVTGLWQTPQVRSRRPKPEDEARNVQWYLENTLFDVVGDVYEEVERALAAECDEPIDVPKLFEFRTWAGGDRDGNPNVTPDVTESTLDRQRSVVLRRYREQLTSISNALSQDASRIDVSERLEASLDVPEPVSETRKQAATVYPDEPYRQKLMVMHERLTRVDDIRPGGYDTAEQFYTDLAIIAEDLRANGGETIAQAHVDPLLRQVETFGFTLASMDLRDHQAQHEAALEEALDRQGIDYAALDEAERVDLLTEAILQNERILALDERGELSTETCRVLERFDRLADWQREYGAQAIDTYCISMTESASHVLEVLFLADQADVVDLPDYSGLDIVPLFETADALSSAEEIMKTLYENDAYSKAIEARNGTQEIMLGYSDANKENGFLAANWSLYRTQLDLAAVAESYDVTLRFFHGRGGSVARGGGPMTDALQALPSSTVTGQVKFTEQGEAIAEKYSNPRVAERNLEQLLNAQLRSRAEAMNAPDETVPDEWVDAMEMMATAARTEYRDLLETDDFLDYFRETTPIDVIADLNLGSRPAARADSDSVEDLRAIPWVFAWTQCRCILPGWYSLGTGIQAYLDEGGEAALLQEMYENWPLFRTILDNAGQALARTDLDISEEYAGLAHPDLHERFFPRIETEYEQTVEHILAITGRDTLVEREWVQESLRRRNPYVDPLNLLQAHLLSQSHRTDTEEQTLRLTVKGLAAGMKNTG
jgi:phosphoenolpyruvate carboxylase